MKNNIKDIKVQIKVESFVEFPILASKLNDILKSDSFIDDLNDIIPNHWDEYGCRFVSVTPRDIIQTGNILIGYTNAASNHTYGDYIFENNELNNSYLSELKKLLT